MRDRLRGGLTRTGGLSDGEGSVGRGERSWVWAKAVAAIGTVLAFSMAFALPTWAQAGDATEADTEEAIENAIGKLSQFAGSSPAPLSASGSILRAQLPESVTEISSTGVKVTSESVSIDIGFSDGIPSWSSQGNGFAEADIGGVKFLAAAYPSGTSLLAVIEHRPSSPEVELRFDLGVPPRTSLQLTEEGSVDVVGSDGLTVGSFNPPWALDATGRSLPTTYELKGSQLVQHITLDGNVSYPVVADPQFDPGIISATLYFDRPETLALSYAVAAAAACAAFNAISQPWGAIMSAGCALIWVHFVAVANVAVDEHKCVKFKVGTAVFGGWYYEPGLHDGSHCPSGGSLPAPK